MEATPSQKTAVNLVGVKFGEDLSSHQLHGREPCPTLYGPAEIPASARCLSQPLLLWPLWQPLMPSGVLGEIGRAHV